ncbi:MAG: 30S ribosomal protein S19 [Cytophagales bacterium]
MPEKLTRAQRKGPYVAYHLLEKIARFDAEGKKEPIKTWSRRSMITPEFLDHVFDVHHGNGFTRVRVTSEMLGHKLGEFAPTRKFRGHKVKNPIGKNKK